MKYAILETAITGTCLATGISVLGLTGPADWPMIDLTSFLLVARFAWLAQHKEV